jgi:hypothetical protein
VYQEKCRGLLRVLRGLRQDDRTEDFALVGFKEISRNVPSKNPDAVFRKESDWRRATWNRLGALGAYMVSTVEPEKGGHGWRIVRRALALLPIDAVGAVPSGGRDGPSVYRAFPSDDARGLFKLMAWLFRYPVGMMYGDVRETVRILHYREDKRLAASYGLFRSLPPAKVKDGATKKTGKKRGRPPKFRDAGGGI